ncbi:AAA family ATPase [Candidatus Shapirobacteria bacterium CG10_big_fil_rev_8_21_14_0_10_40_9]|uniref:AAA family ATPase n=1 Tax=Candidatus Shapirobacteria bacterium CG10_big_fil_rev_8_21_14_0_10_40_9 TaxID=1974888 RepID=A0A2M8L3U1_9BACT|nr:MAG: AAA family ATPase [Candidatus Shapirobacteria bacterium CG10_big_fil_rev_8_21_14_0_10_40_9]
MENSFAPLADKVRPKTLKEFVGQEHLVGKNGVLRKLIEGDQLVSIIFWGPPGSGKTTLAHIIANRTKSRFFHYSAVTTTLDDVRKVVSEAKERLSAYNQRTILFLDEIHRFNKAQQDAFLPHVEKGTITLIGATTENPSFEVISPLLSRCRVLVLNQLSPEELKSIAKRGLKETKAKIKSDALDFLIQSSNGDARVVLNALEISQSLISSKSPITLEIIQEALQRKSLLYDRAGEEHYNTISAFIKSMRASDVDAALYYLARMVEAGEDPLFIARRMVIFASEDIGMAQPTALVVANEVFKACEEIGYPECAINLAHGTVYLAKAPKDRSAYNGLREAQEDVKKHGNLPIPLEILNAPTKLMKDLGYGKGYEPYPGKDKSLLPKKLKDKKYYHPK